MKLQYAKLRVPSNELFVLRVGINESIYARKGKLSEGDRDREQHLSSVLTNVAASGLSNLCRLKSFAQLHNLQSRTVTFLKSKNKEVKCR